MNSNIVSKRIPRFQPLLVAFGLGPSTSAPRNGEVRRVDPGYMCGWVCTSLCVRVCVCLGAYVNVCVPVSVYVCVCACVHVCGHVCVCLSACGWACGCVYLSVYFQDESITREL